MYSRKNGGRLHRALAGQRDYAGGIEHSDNASRQSFGFVGIQARRNQIARTESALAGRIFDL